MLMLMLSFRLRHLCAWTFTLTCLCMCVCVCGNVYVYIYLHVIWMRDSLPQAAHDLQPSHLYACTHLARMRVVAPRPDRGIGVPYGASRKSAAACARALSLVLDPLVE